MASGEGVAGHSFKFFEADGIHFKMKAGARDVFQRIFEHAYAEPVLKIMNSVADGWRGNWYIRAGGYNEFVPSEPPRDYEIIKNIGGTARSLGDSESLKISESPSGTEIRAHYRNNAYEGYLRKSAAEKEAVRERFVRKVEEALEGVYEKLKRLPAGANAVQIKDMGLQFVVEKSLEPRMGEDLARQIAGFVTSRVPPRPARARAAAAAAAEEGAAGGAEEEQGGGGRRRRISRRKTRRVRKTRRRH